MPTPENFAFNIEKDVPVPTTDRAARGSKYQWGTMEVNDSVPIKTTGDVTKLRKTIWSSISTYRKRNPSAQFVARIEGTDTVRVWRVADKTEA